MGGLSGGPTKCRYCRYTATMGHCHGNHFLAFYVWDAHWCHLTNTTEPSVCGGDAALCQITLTPCLLLLLWIWVMLLITICGSKDSNVICIKHVLYSVYSRPNKHSLSAIVWRAVVHEGFELSWGGWLSRVQHLPQKVVLPVSLLRLGISQHFSGDLTKIWCSNQQLTVQTLIGWQWNIPSWCSWWRSEKYAFKCENAVVFGRWRIYNETNGLCGKMSEWFL